MDYSDITGQKLDGVALEPALCFGSTATPRYPWWIDRGTVAPAGLVENWLSRNWTQKQLPASRH
jgi:hypothetical protein